MSTFKQRLSAMINGKVTLLILIISVIFLSFSFITIRQQPKKVKCIPAFTYAQTAMMKFRKASEAGNIDQAKALIKEGMEQSKKAADFAGQCKCVESRTFSLTSHTLAKKVYDEGKELEKVKKDIKKAIVFSTNAMTAAQKCDR